MDTITLAQNVACGAVGKMKKGSCASLLCALVVVVVLANARVTEAVTCNPSELSPCLPAFTSGQAPSANCCNKLKEQKPCLCGYIKNPNLSKYVNSPYAKKVLSTCGVPVPTC
ncbi:hypothetical protein RHSIM_Rhsim10G0070900 [Rhododendron simsii]|uniref:Bifunctional inhibitor/plant lipid transfer protein/seed storage helical domain-containing protein n=1 Tax=Rhododendron simsii TaxID=118357 RepID=A0A834G952_RHOSS|nr:hypothetical protein RHSIM_Rhsim10G0070900 [Rhododendron simsii]